RLLQDAFSEPARRSRKFWPDSSLSHPVTHLRPRLPMALLPPPTLGLLPAGTTTCRVGFAPTEQQHLHGAHAAGVTETSPGSRGFASAAWEPRRSKFQGDPKGRPIGSGNVTVFCPVFKRAEMCRSQ